tara:strand:+ start:364 stop:1695 length:1332 start_codon:yes stop_codon:yes gene_type:complete
MEPVVVVGGARVFLGDCREVLRGLPDNSVDSVVTDPPYELGFMGKSWDSSGIAYDVTVWEECLRVLKPGGHVLAFGGSRTWHRLAVAVEDAGFELRDSIAWLYGSGFPKSLDVSKAIDKNLGAEREAVVEVSEDLLGEHENPKIVTRTGKEAGTYGAMTGVSPQTHASSSEAKTWQGWGTALKPAHEPVVVGRKPFGKGVTVAENVLAWGVGGLNIENSRIGTTVETWPSSRNYSSAEMSRPGSTNASDAETQKTGPVPAGRWPANVILDEVTAGLLDEQSGVSASVSSMRGAGGGGDKVQQLSYRQDSLRGHNDSGGASRFFYVAKASKRDRNEGLEELEDIEAKRTMSGGEDTRGRPVPTNRNFHPTVKPTQLMRYLIKLVTPAGGTVLDPFTGSGSTGKAALLDGFDFVGAELTEEYLPIIEGRLRWAMEQEGETDERLF